MEKFGNLKFMSRRFLFFVQLFFLINSYTTGISSKVLENILNLTVNKEHNGKVSSGEIGLPMENSKLVLPCGIYGRWEK